jgi:8-oxo-dGTP pyrophosphatase MutT (NUDIX family)
LTLARLSVRPYNRGMTTLDLQAYLTERLALHAPRRVSQPDLAEAGVLVAITMEAEPHVILTRRATHLSSHKGEVAFPGGKRDPEDENIVVTALREAQEEVALNPSDVIVLGELDQVVSRFGYLVTPVLALIPAGVTLVPNLDELDAVFKVPLAHFKQPPSRYFEMGNIRIPSYDFEGFYIWGLTAMMIAEMMNNLWDSDIAMSAEL